MSEDTATEEGASEDNATEVGIPGEPAASVAEHGEAGELPETGDPRVDEALAALAGIEDLPTGEHVGIYDQVHRGLQDALANLDQG